MKSNEDTRVVRNCWERLRTRPRRALIQLKVVLGIDARLDAPDRRILEDVILTHYGGRDDVRTGLFAGCAWYTHHYWKFFRGKSLCSIDPDPRKRKYARRYTRHVVDGLEQLHSHFPRDYFDVILCNGVFGWGIDDRETCDAALRACSWCLRPAGELVVGWNDIPGHAPFPLDELPAVRELDRVEPSPLGPSRYRVGPPGEHVFDFFVKRG